MANSYSISHHTWKQTKKLFFHLSDLAILNSYILLSSCGAKGEYRGQLGRPHNTATNIGRLEPSVSEHLPAKTKQL